MAVFDHDDVRIHYEVHGHGQPVLLLAPGGLRSALEYWQGTPWNPIEQLAPDYLVIAMDQRNAGSSTGPVTADAGWSMYTRDQLALLDHLGVGSFHVMGMCIGGPFIMGLIEAAPERVTAGVVMQPIGLFENRDDFYDIFDDWAAEVRPAHPEASEQTWADYRARMFDGEFMFNTSEEFVSECSTPLLVLMGNDIYHPQSTSRRVAELAPNATLIEAWKEPENREAAMAAVEQFLSEHTPDD